MSHSAFITCLILFESHSSPLPPWTCRLHAYHIGTEYPFWFYIVAESVIKSAETMGGMSGATVNSSPVNPSTTVPHCKNGGGPRRTLTWAANHLMTLLQPLNSHSHTMVLNRTVTENGGCICKDDKWESSRLCLLALCALTLTSLRLTGIGQIAVLRVWRSICLPVAQQKLRHSSGWFLEFKQQALQRSTS